MIDTLTNDQKTFIAKLASEGIVALAEFRGEKPEIVEYIDKKSGFKRYIAKHNIALEYLGSGEQVPAELYTPRGAEAAFDKDGKQISDQPKPDLPAKTGLTRGQTLIVGIGSFFQKSGNLTCRVKDIVRLDNLQSLAIKNEEAPDSAQTNYTLKPRAPKA